MTVRTTFLEAAATAADLVTRIDHRGWAGPGLGAWDLRALVGHTSRSLITVLTYLDRPQPSVVIATPEAYYGAIASAPPPGGQEAIVRRGVEAGAALGPAPAQAFAALVVQVRDRLALADDDAVIETIAGAMRVGAYLPTRTFELVVHSLDISRATGLAVDLPLAAVAESAALAGRIAAGTGAGVELLLAVTGRTSLPDGFTIV